MKQTSLNKIKDGDIVATVKQFLLMPIEVDKNIDGFYVHNSKIYSGIKYGKGDPDMSEVAIRFYELLYNFEGVSWSKFNDKKSVFSVEDIMGDTMNSVSRVVPLASEEGIVFKEKYHCLANFWVLPMKAGRKTNQFSKNTPPHGRPSKRIEIFNKDIKDFMDRYLSFLHDGIGADEEMTSYYKYYLKMLKLDYADKDWFLKFCKKHYMIGSFVDENGTINGFSQPEKEGCLNETDVDSMIDTMWDLIQKRAQNIAKSEIGVELYNVLLKNKEQ